MSNPRTIREIAFEIKATWPKPYFGAVPYLDAMIHLNKITDSFGLDEADTILLYFLANARTWRGADARRIKAEIRDLLKEA